MSSSQLKDLQLFSVHALRTWHHLRAFLRPLKPHENLLSLVSRHPLLHVPQTRYAGLLSHLWNRQPFVVFLRQKSCYKASSGLKLEILLPQPPKGLKYRHVPSYLALKEQAIFFPKGGLLTQVCSQSSYDYGHRSRKLSRQGLGGTQCRYYQQLWLDIASHSTLPLFTCPKAEDREMLFS